MYIRVFNIRATDCIKKMDRAFGFKKKGETSEGKVGKLVSLVSIKHVPRL